MIKTCSDRRFGITNPRIFCPAKQSRRSDWTSTPSCENVLDEIGISLGDPKAIFMLPQFLFSELWICLKSKIGSGKKVSIIPRFIRTLLNMYSRIVSDSRNVFRFNCGSPVIVEHLSYKIQNYDDGSSSWYFVKTVGVSAKTEEWSGGYLYESCCLILISEGFDHHEWYQQKKWYQLYRLEASSTHISRI